MASHTFSFAAVAVKMLFDENASVVKPRRLESSQMVEETQEGASCR